MPREFELFRVHAYAVFPRRTSTDGSDGAPEPDGGAIQVSTALRDALAESYGILQNEQIAIDLNVDPTTRTSAIRDTLMRYAFGATQTPVRAAQELAQSLSSAMDERSTPCLMVVAAYRNDRENRVSIWTFPKEEAFQFRAGGRPSIELLQDIFSRRSKLRKGATFTGKERQPDFVRGGVLDFQATSLSRLAADFWIVRFLNARLALQSNTATRRLVGALQNVFASLEDPEARTQVYAAMLTLRSGPQRRWSVRKFAESQLDGEARQRLLDEMPREMLDEAFALDRGVIEERIKVRAFDLDGGILVSAPLDTVGRQVRVEGKNLTVRGTIKGERVRSRR